MQGAIPHFSHTLSFRSQVRNVADIPFPLCYNYNYATVTTVTFIRRCNKTNYSGFSALRNEVRRIKFPL